MNTSNCVIPCILDGGECRVISSYTEPQMYYMIDFSSPGINQDENYRLNQGRNAYTVVVKWNYDDSNDFDTASSQQ